MKKLIPARRNLRYIFFTIAILISPSIFSQSIQNIVVKSNDNFNTILIYYDLVSEFPTTSVQVIMTYKRKGDVNEVPIKIAEGDLGNAIMPGLNKQITWHASDELVDFEGSISFVLSYKPELELSSSVKRGKSIQTDLTIDKRTDNYAIALYEKGVFKRKLPDNYTPGSVAIPKDVKAAKGYQIALEKSDGQPIYSTSFKVKRRFPIALRVLAVVVGTGIVTLIYTNKANEPLPEAPLPGNLINP